MGQARLISISIRVEARSLLEAGGGARSGDMCGGNRVKTYSDASLGSLSIRKPHTGHPLGFSVKESDIGDLAEFGALVADVFFDLEHSGRIVLERRVGLSEEHTGARVGGRNNVPLVLSG